MGLGMVNPKVWLFLLALFLAIFAWRVFRSWLVRRRAAWRRAQRARREARARREHGDGGTDGDRPA
jgi:hypothetical protein